MRKQVTHLVLKVSKTKSVCGKRLNIMKLSTLDSALVTCEACKLQNMRL